MTNDRSTDETTNTTRLGSTDRSTKKRLAIGLLGLLALTGVAGSVAAAVADPSASTTSAVASSTESTRNHEDGSWEDDGWDDGYWGDENSADDGYWIDEDNADGEWEDDGWDDYWDDGEYAENYEDEGDYDEDYGDQDEDEDEDGYEDDSFGADSEEALATFPVENNSLNTSDVDPELAKQANDIWQRFAQLIPASQRQMVSSFELAPAEQEGAYVYPSEADPTKWVLGVSQDLGDDLDYVLIHEFGHLLTLQAKEVPPSGDEDGCTTYFTGEGCALQGSTFAEFVQKFWPQELLDELENSDNPEAFYDKYQDRFVTDYATTNPGEDLAETFAVFVTQERPTGDSIADQKVQFLWSDPAMVDLRTQILANR